MECNTDGQVIENSIPNIPITIEVEVHFTMDGGKSVEGETRVTPPIDNMHQAESTAPESTAPKSTAPESTAPESTAPETTAPKSTAPDSTAPESTV